MSIESNIYWNIAWQSLNTWNTAKRRHGYEAWKIWINQVDKSGKVEARTQLFMQQFPNKFCLNQNSTCKIPRSWQRKQTNHSKIFFQADLDWAPSKKTHLGVSVYTYWNILDSSISHFKCNACISNISCFFTLIYPSKKTHTIAKLLKLPGNLCNLLKMTARNSRELVLRQGGSIVAVWESAAKTSGEMKR